MDKCIRCDGPLERGFMLDKGESNITSQAVWASGEPNTSWFRLSAAKSGSMTMPIITYRCKTCGRLESFAHSAA